MHELIQSYGLITIKLVMAIGVALVFLKFFNTSRQLRQMTPLDVVLNFLLSAILSNFILDENITPLDFTVIMAIYAALLYVMNKITFKTNLGRRIFIGTPRVIIKNGKINTDMMTRMKIGARDLATAMRKQKIKSIKDVQTAQIEPGGDLTIVKKGDAQYAIIIIDNGIVDPEALNKINRTERWLAEQLRAKNISDPAQVFIAQWHRGRLSIIKN